MKPYVKISFQVFDCPRIESRILALEPHPPKYPKLRAHFPQDSQTQPELPDISILGPVSKTILSFWHLSILPNLANRSL